MAIQYKFTGDILDIQVNYDKGFNNSSGLKIVMSHPLEHQDLVMQFIPNCITNKTILDVGCGKGNWGYLIRSLKEEYDVFMVGLDLSKKYLHFVQRFKIYDDVILCDARYLPFRKRKFDFIILTEVIEHIAKSDGFQLIGNLKEISRKRILITTPNGRYYQGTVDGEASQKHVSSWYVSDFKELGFYIRGFGFRFLQYSRMPFIYGLLDNIFTPISYFIPYVARFLIAFYDAEASGV